MAICQQIFEYGLQEHAKRDEEINSFWECVEEAKTENKELGMVAIENFMNIKKKVGGRLLIFFSLSSCMTKPTK